MILTCETCGKKYDFPDESLRARVYVDGPHSLMPVGQRLGCDGTLRSTEASPATEIDFREIAKRQTI